MNICRPWPQQWCLLSGLLAVVVTLTDSSWLAAQSLPPNDGVKPVKLITVPEYCEGVVFDRAGIGYTSHGKQYHQIYGFGRAIDLGHNGSSQWPQSVGGWNASGMRC